MTAALSIADEGYDVFLVEKTRQTGRKPAQPLPDRRGPQPAAAAAARSSSACTATSGSALYHNTEVIGFEGHVGNFRTRLSYAGNGEPPRCWEIEHGVTVVATGGYEYKGNVYLYGQDPRVVTQLELEKRLAEDVDAARAAASR